MRRTNHDLPRDFARVEFAKTELPTSGTGLGTFFRFPCLIHAAKHVRLMVYKIQFPICTADPAATCLAMTPLRQVQQRQLDSAGHLLLVQDREGPEVRVVGVVTLHDLLRAEILLTKDQEE